MPQRAMTYRLIPTHSLQVKNTFKGTYHLHEQRHIAKRNEEKTTEEKSAFNHNHTLIRTVISSITTHRAGRSP